MKQITVTEHNQWEGETFSYVLNVDDDTLSEIKKGLSGKSNVKIEEDTDFTPESIKPLNRNSGNAYMARYQFCKIKLPNGKFDWYRDVFYKAIGLDRV